MKKILVLGIFSLLWIAGAGQAVIDTLKNAKAWQNTYVSITDRYGLTKEGHAYAVGIKCNAGANLTPLSIELVVTDLVNHKVFYKTVNDILSPGSPGTVYWTNMMDSSGDYYISINYPTRRVLRLSLKDLNDSGIQYKNLGNVFADGVGLAYSMRMGRDGHMYFGESSGSPCWSEYDPKADSFVHKYSHSIDDWNDYVFDIAGDTNWVYAEVGQRNNTIKLYAVNKSNDSVTELFHIPASSRFQIEVRQHGIFVSESSIGTYQLDSGRAKWLSWGRNVFPSWGGNRVDYYEVGDWAQPMARTFYDVYNSILYSSTMCCYGNNSGWPPYSPNQITSTKWPNQISVLFNDWTKPNDIGFIGNYYGIWFWHDDAKDSTYAIGSTNFNVYSFIQKDDTHLLYGTYPNGTILEWDRTKPWNVNTYNPNGSVTTASYTTNPRIVAEFRTHTPAQFHHAKFMVKIGAKYVVGGDVIRTANTCSVGAMDSTTYSYWGYDCNRIDRLSMTGMAVWNNLAVIATSNAYGGTAKIYFYNPDSAINTMVDSIQIAGWTNYATYGLFHIIGDTLVGSHARDEFYKINLTTKQVIFDTSNYMCYAAGDLEDGYLWMNRPTGTNCINMPSNCGMPARYMLRYPYYALYNASSFNHIVYSISYDKYYLLRVRGLYPLSAMNSSKITTSSSFYISPNPSKGTISVSMSGVYSIYSREGRLLFRGEIVAHEPLNIDWPGNGVYFIRNHKTGRTQRILIVK